MPVDAITLAQQLIRFPSLNPPGLEKACAAFIAELLSEHGFAVESYAFAEDRLTLIARIPGTGSGKPLCFTGHIDVVPVGTNP